MKSKILNLEKEYWNAMTGKDYETVKNLTKFPCIVAGRQGVMSVDEPGFKKMFEQGRNKTMTVKKFRKNRSKPGKITR